MSIFLFSALRAIQKCRIQFNAVCNAFQTVYMSVLHILLTYKLPFELFGSVFNAEYIHPFLNLLITGFSHFLVVGRLFVSNFSENIYMIYLLHTSLIRLCIRTLLVVSINYY